MNSSPPGKIKEFLHIIALENEPSSFRGGQELSLLNVCQGLYKRGHTISLLYLKEGNLLEQYQEFCKEVFKIDGYMLDRKRMLKIFKFWGDISKIPVEENSIVYSNRYHDLFFGYMLSFCKKASLVCHLRLPPPKTFGRPHTIGLKGTKQFITTSMQTKLDWIESGIKEEKIDVVHNAIDPKIFKPSINFEQTRKEWNIQKSIKVISYVGRLDQEKGLETLIRAFALLVRNCPNVRLLIAGKPLSTQEKYGKLLQDLSCSLGIEKQVDFLGHITNTTSLYQVSDVTVLPSLWSEPFGKAIIESMACSTPVVASRTGGIPEILTGEFQNWLFEPGNEQDLLDKLTGIINWRETAPQLGERCREHVLDKFCPEKMVDSIEKVLLRVANSVGLSAN